jgi:amino acid transporter
MDTNFTSHIKKGAAIAVLLIILNIIAQVLKQSFESWHRISFIVLFIFSLIASSILFKKECREDLPFGVLFTHNFKTATVTVCLFFIYTLLAVYLLFPGQFDFMMGDAMEQAKKQGKSPAELQENITMAKKVIVLSFISGGLVMNLITGVLGALLGAVIARKTN